MVRGMGKRSDDQLAAAWHELMGRYHRVSCALDRELQAEHGITVSDFEVLQELYAAGADQRLPMHELGERVHLTQSALSRLITRLERDGLVKRCECDYDRRTVLTCITPAGIKRYESAKPTQRAILRDQSVTA